MSCAVTVVMVISTAVTWPLYTYLLVPNGLGYLQTIVFILVIAALVQLLETALRKYMPPLYNALGIYLPLITTNCAVLGVTMLVLEKGAEDPTFGYLQSLVNAFGSGVGFLVAMVLFAGVRERLENCDIPETFKGLPDVYKRQALWCPWPRSAPGTSSPTFWRRGPLCWWGCWLSLIHI